MKQFQQLQLGKLV